MIETKRPLVTFALFSYNQEQYVREAIQGALDQDYTPLEIILSDDASSDRTYEIMQSMTNNYSGPHQIVLNQNQKNLGIGGHLNRLMEMARGEFIVVAAGDDISLPNRVETVVAAWQAHDRNVISIYSSLILIDKDGSNIGIIRYSDGIMQNDLYSRIRGSVSVEGASHAFSPQLFSFFGPLPVNAINEDVILQFRAALTYGVATISTPLVKYRKHTESVNYYRENTCAEFAAKQSVLCDRYLVCLQQFTEDIKKYKSLPEFIGCKLNLLEQVKNTVTNQKDLTCLRKEIFLDKLDFVTLAKKSPTLLAKGLDIKVLASYFVWLLSPRLFVWLRNVR